MAEPLKNIYSPSFFEKLCPVLQREIKQFDCMKFIHTIFNEQWPELELKQRVRQITKALHDAINKDYPTSIVVVTALASALKQNGIKDQGFELIFLADYVELYGVEFFNESMQAIEGITQIVSCEFAIRPFLIFYPEKTMEQMLKWSLHKNDNVRRLASEGCRPRLPWAVGIANLKKNPSSILPILENLKNDSSLYVRRSVANNLNDIAKDHPELVLSTSRRWYGTNQDTDWIIKKGCRTLLKKGNEMALALHGMDTNVDVDVHSVKLKTNKVKIGGRLDFAFTFINKELKPAKLRLDYSVDYKTSSGKTSTKIFKISEQRFEPDEKVLIKKSLSFRDLSTRKHFKGKHTIKVLVNGKAKSMKSFVVS